MLDENMRTEIEELRFVDILCSSSILITGVYIEALGGQDLSDILPVSENSIERTYMSEEKKRRK